MWFRNVVSVHLPACFGADEINQKLCGTSGQDEMCWTRVPLKSNQATAFGLRQLTGDPPSNTSFVVKQCQGRNFNITYSFIHLSNSY